MADTLYCYHCRTHHPKEEMGQVPTKDGKRWRCIKSIEGANKGRAAREAFGRQTTANNKADAQAVKSRMANSERNQDA
jgi:hypothetical protein